MQAEALEVFNAARREVTQPVVLISELLNFIILQPKTLHDLPLVLHTSCLGCSLALGIGYDIKVKTDWCAKDRLHPSHLMLQS